MIPAAFDYSRAITVEDAIAQLSGGDHKLLAGGYSLLPSMKLRLSQPAKLVDISAIPSLKGIKEENGHIVIGAGTTHHDIGINALIKEHLPFFTDAAAMIGDVQVRNRGTIGGSLAHADPAADWPALVLASEATIEVMGSGGSRTIKAEDFFTGFFSTDLQDGEIITSIKIPVPQKGSKMVYLKYSNPASRFAVVGCAVIRHPGEKINIGFTGVADTPFRDTNAEAAMSGKPLTEVTIEEAAKAAAEGVNINHDLYASAGYRKHLAKVFLKRALHAVS